MEDLIRKKSTAYIKRVVCEALNMSTQQLNNSTPFEKYGLDSILVVHLTNKLRTVFKSITTTLFFECNTIDELTSHLLNCEKEALIALTGVTESDVAEVMVEIPQTPKPPLATEIPALQARSKRRFSSSTSAKEPKRDAIAIVGLAGKYPQAASMTEFWQNLQAGKNCISEIPPDRWNWQQYFGEGAGKIYTKWGGFINDIDKFDPLFFNISPREAETMDPQERLFLETAYTCIEDAGYSPSSLSDNRKVGVFVGVMNNNYPGGARHWSIANRVSYLLNFFGPSMAVDTACSSSLTAIHTAVESIHNGSCECAIAGGVNLIVDPAHYQRLVSVGMLSHDDRNKAFGAGADGFVDSEGVGAILLKPLPQALADGDHIYGLIKGSAINSGGKTSGYTVPNPKAQFSLIAQAIKSANINPRTLSYIEAHGTGTSLGDPIEIAGLSKAVAEYTQDQQFCAIGSVKSNIGHCEGAAGIAGISKIILQLKHQQLVASLHAEQANPEIDFAATPFKVQQQLSAWERPVIEIDGIRSEYPRRAGISSFGAGGANAHIIIEEYVKNQSVAAQSQNSGNNPPLIFVLSAKNDSRLKEYAENIIAFVKTQSVNLVEMLYTLQVGREPMEERLGLLVDSVETLCDKLESFIAGKDDIDGFYHGNLKQNKNALAVFKADEDLQHIVNTWISRGKYAKVLELWIKGLAFDWTKLYGESKPNRISLPGYPFAKERYWLLETPTHKTVASPVYPVAMQNLINGIAKQDTAAVHSFIEQSNDFDKLLLPLMQAQLATLENTAEILPLYAKWYQSSLDVFSAGTETLTTPIEELWQKSAEKKAEYAQNPMMKARIELVEATLRALPAILSGKIPATDIMFPNSSLGLVEGIYKNNALSDYFNQMVADIVVSYIKERQKQDPAAKIRIFEIGAGTGGTSSVIFNQLGAYKNAVQEYCYTDLSKAFLMHAENTYGKENPFLRYKIFNAAQSVWQQEVDTHSYDMVIAANVLHATLNIQQTLQNATALLKNHGIILLNELSLNTLFLHLTFGLLEGWWLFDDPELRIKGSPAIAPNTWQQLLAQQGFANIKFPAQQQHEFGLQIIVAEKEGITKSQQPQIAQIATVTEKTPAPQRVTKMARGIGISEQMLENHVKETIVDKLSESLKVAVELIENDESFSDYGVDSIIGVSFVEQLNQSLAIKLETTIIFDYSTVNKLAAYILSAYKNSLANTLLSAASDNSVFQEVFTPVVMDSEPSFNSTFSIEQKPAPEQKAIAIIGMSGRFPQSESVEELWQHLENGDDLIEEVTRWDLSPYFAGQKDSFCRSGGFLSDIDKFDPLFFNISGSEANYMDPQQRLFLQESWKALEDAGYAGARIEGHKCGVYVGCGQSDYKNLFHDNIPAQAFWGNMSSIVPARIAYYLDLQGPAIAVDTACSSSMTAIHIACQGLWNRETELALAGGVFITFTPELYVMANKAGMLSASGRCHTFDQRADGFVPGEGVGVVVLKRLEDAVADGDHIYGVIRGIGINQDGATNGITAPSGNSQERLEQQVYDSFNINPEHISMVEAHGTGTILGDPIECTALKKAFQKYTDKKQYCVIGSVKTNIGHTQLASGVAGVIKVLLSMQHKKIPPSLHYQTCNANIAFENSPFYVNTELKNWDTEAGLPRLAAISAFGASGTNAHMVIEEGLSNRAHSPETQGYLIVLSARTSEQLKHQVEQLLDFCKKQPAVDCGNMSRTLLLGRKHFKHRLACVPRNAAELVGFFEKWLEKGKVRQVYVAELNESGQREQPSLKQYGNQCIENSLQSETTGNYLELLSTIADLYIQGYALDFGRLFQRAGYSTLSLPTYPFAKNRYWVEESDTKQLQNQRVAAENTSPAAKIHPLLHRNTSDFSQQRFSSTFSGTEFFLKDHVVQDQKVLPGVAYLEMARAATEQAIGTVENEQSRIVLKNVVWAQPIAVENQAVDVYIGLTPEDNGDIGYEIYSQANQSTANSVVHSQGIVKLNEIGAIPKLDIAALKSQCQQKRLSAEECYETFLKIGLDYGAGHRGIQEIYVGNNQAMAKLVLPASVTDSADEYVLHPGLMDSALQATLGLSAAELDKDGVIRPFLAFALERLEIFRTLSSSIWAFIRYSQGSSAADSIRKIDIDLCDEQGNVCVKIEKFTSRELGSKTDVVGTLLIKPSWRFEPIPANNLAVDYEKHLVILIEPEKSWRDSIVGKIANAEWIILESKQKDIAKRFEIYVFTLFARIKEILQAKPKRDILFQVLLSSTQDRQLFVGFLALLKTAHAEYSKLIGQLIEIDEAFGINPEILKENANCKKATHIKYQGNQRFVSYLEEIKQSPENAAVPWKNNGIYLITGGLGGLGFIFAKEIAQQVENPVLILSDRKTDLDEAQQHALAALAKMGAIVKHQQADVANKTDVENLISSIEKEFGRLDGILHTAGLIRDNFIINKTQQEFDQVLAPKVAGLINLDVASRHLALDFFIMFSSVAGVLSNIGQADYACANAFMDFYAKYRQELVHNNKRHGKTLSIDWPLWKHGGMRLQEAVERMMLQNFGIVAMATEAGIQALYHALSTNDNQVMVMTGNLTHLRRTLNLSLVTPAREIKPSAAAHPVLENIKTSEQGNDTLILAKLNSILTQNITQLLKIPAAEIDPDAELSDFGFDSISLTEFSNNLNQAYQLELTPVLFFEYSTVNSFANYLLDEHRAVFSEQVTPSPQTTNQIFTQVVEYEEFIMEAASLEAVVVDSEFDDSLVLDKLKQILKQNVTQLLKIAAEELDVDAELSEFGFDSISLTEFSNNLNQEYGLELTPVLFFEYSTIHSFAKYLLDEHQEIFAPLVMVKTKPQAAAPVASKRFNPVASISENRAIPKQRHSRFIKTVAVSAPQQQESIAIIGLSGLFPKAKNVEEFWANLADGKDCIAEVPKQRWNWDFFTKTMLSQEDSDNIKWGGFLDGVENFDPVFFGISPKEAELMDPQQRLLMTETWKALEDAGYAREYSFSEKQDNKTGVFIGTIGTDYDRLEESYGIPAGIHSLTGNNPALLSARIASFLNLKGPNLAVATTCSSSLVAINLACQSILAGESEMAVAGGTFIMSTPERYFFMSKGGLLSPSGKCRTFDNQADGFIPGESVGVVVLKPLSSAIKDRDHIYGVIKGCGVNHDGRSSGITAPSRASQKELAVSVYEKAGINPKDVTYIEAHGTASKLGDHIEFSAMSDAFRDYTDKKHYCAIGSVRTNIGHSVSSACISSVIKVIMGLKYQKIPPSLNFAEPNEYINFNDSPFYVPTKLIDWQPAEDGKRRASINAFALSGTNAHAIIEEFIAEDISPQRTQTSRPAKPLLFILSAKSSERLTVYARNMADFLQKNRSLALEDIAFTLQIRRMEMEDRLVIFASNMDELVDKFAAYADDNKDIKGLYTGNARKGKKLYSLLFEGETGNDYIRLAMARKEMPRVAQLWVNGAKIDWHSLYEGSSARHISLPTYPFTEKRFWLSQAELPQPAPIKKAVNPKSTSVSYDFSRPTEVKIENKVVENPIKSTDAKPKVLYNFAAPEKNVKIQHQEIQHQEIKPANTALFDKVREELLRLLSGMLKVNAGDIDCDMDMSEYNLDSIVLTEYVGKINEKYDFNLMPMALVNYSTISSFAGYLVKEYAEAIEEYYA